MAGVSSAPAQHTASQASKLDSAPAVVASDNKTTAAAQVTNPVSPATVGTDPTANPANVNGTTAEQKKDRKPRRERLPLPDPIPTEPVKRYPEPSKVELQAAIDAQEKKLQACFDRLNSTRAFFDERQKIRDAGKPTFDAARKRLTELNEQCRLYFEARKEITARLKGIKEADIAARNASASAAELVGAGKDGTEALRNVRSVEDLETRIKELEYELSSATLSIAEEKKIVSQISFLQHKGREFITGKDKTLKDEKAAKEMRATARKELEGSRAKQDSIIDAAKAQLEEQRKVVDGIRAKQESEIKKLQESTSDIDRDAEKKKIGELKTAIRDLREEFQVKLDKWYLNERIHYEQQKIAKRKRYEAAQAEREARRKAWEAEQAQYPEPDPYQEQKDKCSGLIVYLQTLLGETVDKPSVNLRGTDGGNAPSLKSTSATREITAMGRAIGKSSTGNDDGFENLAFGNYMKKNSRKGKKGRRSAAPATKEASGESGDTLLKPHPIDYFAGFNELGVTAPKKMSEVRAALDQVKEKKVYYDNLPKPTEEEKAKMAANKTKKQAAPTSEKKNKANNAELLNGDGSAAAFPVLLGENSAANRAAAARDVSGPSFMDVASGAAPAPPPTPAVSTVDMPSLNDESAAGIVQAALGMEAIAVDQQREVGLVAPADATLTEA